MTTYNTTVTNGQATVKVDTTDMAVGNYDVETTYSQNNKYNVSIENSMMALTPWNGFSVGVDTNTPFTLDMFTVTHSYGNYDTTTSIDDGIYHSTIYNNHILTAYPLKGDFELTTNIRSNSPTRVAFRLDYFPTGDLNAANPPILMDCSNDVGSFGVSACDANGNYVRQSTENINGSDFSTIKITRYGTDMTWQKNNGTVYEFNNCLTDTCYLDLYGWSDTILYLKNVVATRYDGGG